MTDHPGQGRVAPLLERGLRLIPDLHFEVVAYYVGVDTLVINYRNQKGGLVAEVLTFEGDLVASGHGTYSVGSDNPAGVRRRRRGRIIAGAEPR